MAAPFVDVAHIRRLAQGGAYERGIAYFQDGAVRTVTWDPASCVVESVVAGSAHSSYRCRIRLDPRAGTTDRVDAVHVPDGARLQAHGCHAAREQSARERRPRGRPADIVARAPRAAIRPHRRGRRRRWRSGSSCASGCDAARRAGRRCASRAHRREGCISSAPTCWSAPPARAQRRTDAWIKGDVSWDVLRRPGTAYEPAQARWFAELYSIARDMRPFGSFSDASEWLTLDDIESQLLWPHLGSAAEHGVPSSRRGSTRPSSLAPGSIGRVLRAARTPGGLDLTARIAIDGETSTRRRPPDRPCRRLSVRRARRRIGLTLAPVLPGPVHALLGARDAVSVPAEDVEEFMAEHMPRLPGLWSSRRPGSRRRARGPCWS